MRSAFCSNNCRSTARRHAGVDDELRVCAHCASIFSINRYKPARSCSRRVLSVTTLPHRRAVYNLGVDGAPEYFANGVLVHNCAWRYPEAWHQLRFGLRLGTDPRAVVTTTPRPTRLVRELLADPTTVVTRGATHENRANLPASFLDKIVQTYEGTRLGRQELYAEVLEDAPGALWTRDRLESLRVREAPELRTIVIGVDPAVSMGSESAETGIVVAGIGREDGHGYVLDDRSGRSSPDGWAQRVVNAFDTHLANRVVTRRGDARVWR